MTPPPAPLTCRDVPSRRSNRVRPSNRIRKARLLFEDLEPRLVMSAGKITTLTFNVPTDVAAKGVYVGVYGSDAPKNGQVYYAVRSADTHAISGYAPASQLTVGNQVPLVSLKFDDAQQGQGTEQAQLDLPIPTGLAGLYGGELFIFVGQPSPGLVVATSTNGKAIAAPKAMSNPAIPGQPDDFAQFEFTYTAEQVGPSPTVPASLDVDSSAVDSTGFPFSLVYPQSSASFPLNPVGITQTQGDIVLNYNAAFAPGGAYAAYPQFAQDGQVNSQQVVAPQDILSEEGGAPPKLNTAKVSDPTSATNLAGTGNQATLTLNSANVPVLVGMSVAGTYVAPGTFVTSVAVSGSTTTVGISQPVLASGPDHYTFSGNLAPGSTDYLVTAFSNNPVANGVVGETLPSNEMTAIVTAGATVTLAWNAYNDPNTAGYNVYRYIASAGSDAGEYTLIAHLLGRDTTGFTDVGSVSQAQQNGPTALPKISPLTTSNYGFNPLSEYYTQDILDFFNYYKTHAFSMNRVGVQWVGKTVSYTPAAAWNTTGLIASQAFAAGATSIIMEDRHGVIAGETISGPGLAAGTTIRNVIGSTVYLSRATTSGGAAGTSLVVQATYTVLQLTAQSSFGGVTAGQVLNIYQPIFASNTRFVTADGSADGPPAPPMPRWLASNFSPYESPSQMVFGCDGVFASNGYDPDAGAAKGPLAAALGALENSIVSAFNRGITKRYTLPPDNWASFPQILSPPDVQNVQAGTSTLTKGTYYYVITAVNAFGETTPSFEVKAEVTADKAQTVTLTWANGASAPAATSYNIYRAESPNGALTFLTSTQNTTFIDNQAHYASQTDQTPRYQYFTPGTNSNWYAAYVQSNSVLDPVHNVSINGLSYGFPYSDQGGVSTNLYFSGAAIPDGITVNLGELNDLGFLTQNLPAAMKGKTYTQTIVASGGKAQPGNVTFSASGLPSWLTLTPQGVLTLSNGTPVVPDDAQSTSIVITATNGSSTTALRFALNVGIAAQSLPLSIPGLNGDVVELPAAEIQKSYSTTIQVTGGTGAYQVLTLAALPSGLEVGTPTAGGIPISGTPKDVNPLAGFKLLVSDSLNLAIAAAWTSGTNVITVTDPEGSRLTAGMAVSGNGLPAGTIIEQIAPHAGGGWDLTLENAVTGGAATPTSAGTFTFDDAIVFAPNLIINPGLLITSSPQLPEVDAHKPFALQLTTNVNGEDVTFTGQGLPLWVTLSPSGLLTSTDSTAPREAATIKITATSPYTTLPAEDFYLTVGDLATLTLSPGTSSLFTLPAATTGVEYSQTLDATGGDSGYAFLLVNGVLPSGLSLSSDGTIGGKPTSDGNNQAYQFTVRVSDALGEFAFQGYQIVEGTVPTPGLTPKIASVGQVAENATTLVLTGTQFDPTPGNNVVNFSGAGFANVTGTVISATTTQLVVSLSGTPTAAAPAWVTVTVNGQTSNKEFLGDVLPSATPPTVEASSDALALNGVLVITGTGFDTTLDNDSVILTNSGVTARVIQATSTELTVILSGLTLADLGDTLKGQVVVKGVPSGSDVALRTVAAYRPAPTVNSSSTPPNVTTNGTAISITGTGFDTNNALNNQVTLYDANKVALPLTLIQAVSVNSATQLTVTLAQPLSSGVIFAVVNVDGVASNQGEIANIVSTVGPSITSASSTLAATGTTLVVQGSGFVPTSLAGTSTSGSASVTLTSVSGLVAGMQAYGLGVPAYATITSIDTSKNTLTLSLAAGAGAGTGAFVFALPNAAAPATSSVAWRGGSSTNGNATLTLASTFGLYAGLEVTGPGLALGTSIQSIQDATHVILSAVAGPAASAGTFGFHLVNWILASTTTAKTYALSAAATDVVASMTVVGPGVPSGTTVSSILGGQVVLNHTITNPGQAYFFNASTVQYQSGTSTAGSRYVSLDGTTGLAVGMSVFGPGVPPGATITAIVANASITLSIPATSASANPAGAGTFAFVLPPSSAISSDAASKVGTATLTGLSSTSTLFPGMAVTGPGIQAGTTVLSVDSASQVTLSIAAASGAGSGTFTFVSEPVDLTGGFLSGTFQGNTTAQSDMLSGFTSTAGFRSGMTVSGPGILPGTTVLKVDATEVKISTNALGTYSNVDFNFASAPVYQSYRFDSSSQITLSGLSGFLPGSSVELTVGGSGGPTPVATETSNAPAGLPKINSAQLHSLTLDITGSNFDPTGTNVVRLYAGDTELPPGFIIAVDAASATQLLVTLAGPLPAGVIKASVITDGVASAGPVEVATVAGPSVTPDTTTLRTNGPTVLIVHGHGFDPEGTNAVVLFTDSQGLDAISPEAISTVVAVSDTELIVILNTAYPLPSGPLYASVTTDRLLLPAEGSPGQYVYQVATLVDGGPTVGFNSASLSDESSSFEISGTQFSPTAADNVVTLSTVGGTLTGAVDHVAVQGGVLTVYLTKGVTLPVGQLYATVTTPTARSNEVQVANVVNSAPKPSVTATPGHSLAPDALSLEIDGGNFDTSDPSHNVVTLYGASHQLLPSGNVTVNDAGTVLTVALDPAHPLPVGSLYATVIVDGVNAGTMVVVGTVVASQPAPTITPSTARFTAGVTTTLTINGTGFSVDDRVTFNNGAVGSVVHATATQLVVRITTTPTAGVLLATVTSPTSGGSPTRQVATVVPSLIASTSALPAGTTTLTIVGAGFSGNLAANVVQFSSGVVGRVTSVSPAGNSLTVTFSTPPTRVGPLTASVSVNGEPSSTVQVASVTPGRPSAATSLLTVSSNLFVAGQTVHATLQARDAYGNPITTGGAVVQFFSTQGGTLGAVSDHGNGTYVATFQSFRMGVTTLTATLNGASVRSKAVAKVYFASQFPGQGPLPAPWITRAGRFTVANSVATGSPSQNVALYAGNAAANVSESMTVSSIPVGQTAMVIARYTNRLNYYRAGILHFGSKYFAVIQMVFQGKATTLVGKPSNFKGAGSIKFEAEGTTLRLAVNGQATVSTSNSKLNVGKVGFTSVGTARFQNFRADAMNP